MSKKKSNQKKQKKTSNKPHSTHSNNINQYYSIGTYLILFFIILIIFGKTATYDFVVDDKLIILENIYVNKGLSGFGQLITAILSGDSSVIGTTRPVTMLSHAIDVSMFGLNAGTHHLMNIFYYLILVFLLFNLLKKHLLPNHSIWLSFGIILLFTVHPVHVESVANIKGRDDILCFIFGTLAITYLFRHLKNPTIQHKILSIIFLLLSFLSKETGIIFTILLPLTYYYFSNTTFKQTISTNYPYLLLGVILITIRLTVFSDNSNNFNIYNNSLLAIEDTVLQLLMTFRILLHYLQITFIPFPLSWDYSLGHFEYNQTTTFLAYLSIVTFGGLTLWSFTQLKNKSYISYGILFFLIALFPVSNLLIKIPSTFGERFLFIPTFGFAFAFAFLLNKLLNNNNKTLTKFNIFPSSIIAISIFFVVLSFNRTNVWKNETTLVINDFEYANSLRSSRSYIQLLTALPDNKIPNHEKALKICDNSLERFEDDWQLWYFKGIIERTLGNIDAAKTAFLQSIDHKADNFYSLASIADLLANEQPEIAIEYYRKAIAINSERANTLANFGIVLHKLGRFDEAKEMYEKVLNIEPNNQIIRNNLNILNQN